MNNGYEEALMLYWTGTIHSVQGYKQKVLDYYNQALPIERAAT